MKEGVRLRADLRKAWPALGLLLLSAMPAACRTHQPLYVRPPSRCWPRVEVICIDRMTLDNFGKWPIDRGFHARLVDKLVRAGARVIAFDLYFGDAMNSHGDRAFAAAIARSHRTWLILDPTSIYYKGRKDDKIKESDYPKRPLALFASAAQWRIANPLIDSDEISRAVGGIAMAPVGTPRYRQLLVGIMTDYLRLRRWPYPTEDGDHYVVGSWLLPTPGGEFRQDALDSQRLGIHGDSHMHTHSYWRVLRDDYPMGTFRDAIVFVGRTPIDNGEDQLVFSDWTVNKYVTRTHVEALGILMEKMMRYLDVPRPRK